MSGFSLALRSLGDIVDEGGDFLSVTASRFMKL